MNLAVFDVDGTLLDNLEYEDACFTCALREQLMLKQFDTDWARYAHVSDEGIATEAYAREFGQPLPASRRAATINRFIELLRVAHRASPIRMIPGASGLLHTLPMRGWAVALATGAWRRAAHFKLASAGLSFTSFPLATSEDGPSRTSIVKHAVERASEVYDIAKFDRVVAIGDGVWDVSCAKELSLPFVGIGGAERADQLRRVGASDVLTNYVNVDLILRTLEGARIPDADS